jgi:hypothetical protein
MNQTIVWRILVLGKWGFSAKAIQSLVKGYKGEEVPVNTIYSLLSKNNISLRAYRNAETPEAESTLRRAFPKKTKLKIA